MASFDLDITDPASYFPFIKQVVGWSVGQGTPEEQLQGVIILTAAFIASSFFTLGWTLALIVFISMPLAAWAIARLLYQWLG